MVNARKIQLTRTSDVRALADRCGFHPSRALGQNFLIDGNILDILVDAAGIRAGDRVLEVGPGMGVVTAALLERGAHVTAIEKDHRLFALLQETFADEPDLDLIEGDALDLAVPLVRDKTIGSLVSNLPYNPGSRIMIDLICAEVPPQKMTVTVQLEVAERLAAAAGTKAYGLLGLWCQLHCEVRLVKIVSPTCFWPRPAVRSAIVTLCRRSKPLLEAAALPRFYALTRYAFQHRRKQLVSLLTKAPGSLNVDADDCRARLAAAGLGEDARPENLPVEAWCALAGEG
jgi:16S rRNA (adenine1518-N6/adenine1519-N6)-dimethyltransferase